MLTGKRECLAIGVGRVAPLNANTRELAFDGPLDHAESIGDLRVGESFKFHDGNRPQIPIEHPQQALDLFSAHSLKIVMVITDLVMPRMSGLEVASQLTQTRPGIRILLMSGYPNESAMRHGVPPGAALLQKPFNSMVLARAVRHVLDAR